MAGQSKWGILLSRRGCEKSACDYYISVRFAIGQIESPPVLTQPEVERLEAKVAKSPADRVSQKLLAQNYVFFILGITSLDQFGQASGYDPAKAAGDFAKHARAILGDQIACPRG